MKLDAIKGIGTKTIEYLSKKDIYNLEDLVTFYPINYQTYANSNALEDGMQVKIEGMIIRKISEYHPRPGLIMSTYYIFDGIQEHKVIAWNQKHLRFILQENDYVEVMGKYDAKREQIVQKSVKKLENNDFKNNSEKTNISTNNSLIPVYSKINKISNFKIQKLILEAISYIENEAYKNDLKIIHAPQSQEELARAIENLKYREFETYYSKLLKLKKNNEMNSENYIKNINLNNLNKLLYELPFTLTQDQENVLNNIVTSLKSSQKTQTLILGDVGSGKTILAILISYLLVEADYQIAVMAPTEVLARQLYYNFSHILPNIQIDLLTSNTLKKDRKRILDYTQLGITKILIGTHSLLNEEIIFKNLGIAIIDEQHRFGVEQRNKLINKTKYGEFIYMSATPIPRTLAQSVFGVMDVQIIETKPLKRKKIITEIYEKKNKNEIYKILDTELSKGHQAYIIAPTIEETEIEQLENVEAVYEKFQKYYENKYRIGLLHGMMKGKDKEIIMEKFKNNEYDILVATTVIEVGVDVANASVMVVLNAERYGLAQLHQLRGRVGRSDIQSFCLLYDKSNNEISKERLQILKENDNGFVLAQKDLNMRGSGNFFGKEQSGTQGFKLFNYYEDMEIAQEIVKKFENSEGLNV